MGVGLGECELGDVGEKDCSCKENSIRKVRMSSRKIKQVYLIKHSSGG